MARLLYIITVSLLAFSCKSTGPASEAKVFGGEAVARDDPRFQAVYEIVGTHGNCTGVFVTRRKFLTAAHCVTPESAGGIIGFNPSRVGGIPQPATIKHLGFAGEMQLQPLFGTAQAYKDVAVLTFTNTPNVATMALCRTPPTVGDEAYIVGYGLDENGLVGVLRAATGTISFVDRQNSTLYIESEVVTAFRGDSGGPLVSVRDLCVWGVASNIQIYPGDRYRTTYVDLFGGKAELNTFLTAELGVTGPTGGGGGTGSGNRVIEVCEDLYVIAQRPDGSRFIKRKSDGRSQSITNESDEVGQSASFQINWGANPNGLGGAVLFPNDGSREIECEPVG